MRTGYDVFGSAYGVMLRNDLHHADSIDHALIRRMALLDSDSRAALYAAPPPLPDMTGHALYPLAQQLRGESAALSIRRALCMTSAIAMQYDAEFEDMLFGGTEEEILARGTDWCADMARVGAALLMCMGIPARIVHLADLNRAYCGHVVCEAYRDGAFGVCDFIYGFMFRESAYELMLDHAAIRRQIPVARHGDYDQLYDGVAISDYDPTDPANDYTVTRTNEYCRRIIRDSAGGGVWIMGEDE